MWSAGLLVVEYTRADSFALEAGAGLIINYCQKAYSAHSSRNSSESAEMNIYCGR
jgi:hypothetical protein